MEENEEKYEVNLSLLGVVLFIAILMGIVGVSLIYTALT